MTTTAPAPARSSEDVQDQGHLDVLIVGAGVSGIGAAHHLQERFPDRSFLLLDAKSPGVTIRPTRSIASRILSAAATARAPSSPSIQQVIASPLKPITLPR